MSFTTGSRSTRRQESRARRRVVPRCRRRGRGSLEERHLRRVEEQLHVVPQQDVDLSERQRDPDRRAGRRARRDEGVDQREQDEADAIEQIQPQRCRMAAHEPRAGDQPADGAPAILDHDADAGVVEDQVTDDEQRPEGQVAEHAYGERGSLCRHVVRRPRIDVVEEPRMDELEERPIHEPGQEAEAEETPEVRAARGEEARRARWPHARVAIEHAPLRNDQRTSHAAVAPAMVVAIGRLSMKAPRLCSNTCPCTCTWFSLVLLSLPLLVMALVMTAALGPSLGGASPIIAISIPLAAARTRHPLQHPDAADALCRSRAAPVA